jgi:enterochelin esterase-like enzyme
MRKSPTGWLLRGLAVVAMTAIIALWVLVQPLPETPPPTLTPAASEAAQGPTSTPPPTPTLTPTPTATPIPTHTPTSTPTPGEIEGPTATISATTVVEAPVMLPDVQLAGRVEQHTYFSQVTGKEEPYRIYLPPDYDQTDERRYPALYLLHGWPYDESHWDNLGADEVADTGIRAGTLPSFIMVMPGADPDGVYVTTAGGDNSFEGQVLHDLIPQVEAVHRVSTDRAGRAIGGISRGGVWALEIGFRHPDLFAAVGGHSPALKHNMAPTPYDPFHLLEQPGVAALRIYLDAGDTDWALEHTQALHEALDARGIASQFAVHSGGHTDNLWAANLAEYVAFYAAGW